MNDNYNEYALVFKALSDPNRLYILDFLTEGERCACVLLEKLQITQPTLSYHMKILTDCKLINARKEGKWMHYSIHKDKLQELKNLISLFIR